MKKVSLLQPTYLPYPGYFQVMNLVDEFYYMTNVELSRPSFQHRNRLRTPTTEMSRRDYPCHKCGGTAREQQDADHGLYSVKHCTGCGNSFGKAPHGWLWLDVPVVHAHRGTEARLLQYALIDNAVPWAQRHLTYIGSFYKRSAFYESLYPELEEIYTRPHATLYKLNIELIDWLRGHLGVKTPAFLETEYPYDVVGNKTQRLVNFCDAVGADCYVEPEGASFIDEKMFERNGIELRFFHFEPPEYLQLFPGFVPYMSALDMLFCLGPRAKNKIKAEWYDSEIRENLTPELDVGRMMLGGR